MYKVEVWLRVLAKYIVPEETTPPVTNTYLVIDWNFSDIADGRLFYWKGHAATNRKSCDSPQESGDKPMK